MKYRAEIYVFVIAAASGYMSVEFQRRHAQHLTPDLRSDLLSAAIKFWYAHEHAGIMLVGLMQRPWRPIPCLPAKAEYLV